MVFTAGQIGMIPGSLDVVSGVENQAKLSMRSLQRVLNVYNVSVTDSLMVSTPFRPFKKTFQRQTFKKVFLAFNQCSEGCKSIILSQGGSCFVPLGLNRLMVVLLNLKDQSWLIRKVKKKALDWYKIDSDLPWEKKKRKILFSLS